MSNSNKKSTYKVDVLGNNKTFKNAVRSTGKGLRLLKSALQDEPSAKPMLNQIEKILDDNKLYKKLDKNVTRIKKGENKGKTCPYYLLQAIYKMKEGKSFNNSKNNSTKTTTKVTVKPKTEAKKETNNKKPLQKQTVKQLKELATELSINIPTKILKKDLIELIKKAS